MKITTLSVMTALGLALLSSSSFAATALAGDLGAGGRMTNPMLRPDLETRFVVTTNGPVNSQGQANEHYGLAPAWNHPETRETMANSMLTDPETDFIVTTSDPVNRQEQVNEHYGLAPAWASQNSREVMINPMFQDQDKAVGGN